MCIAAPAQVVEINREENWLFADFGGARQQAKLDLLPRHSRRRRQRNGKSKNGKSKSID